VLGKESSIEDVFLIWKRSFGQDRYIEGVKGAEIDLCIRSYACALFIRGKLSIVLGSSPAFLANLILICLCRPTASSLPIPI